ncbi:MAG: serine/threonine-protein kinase, partial [Planctomycetota bacterium]|nr:serine/threonine-protein kinase [Planctomycetota bacterium]
LVQGRYRGFFLGDYKLLNRVARGGMSTIYAAEKKKTGEVHALKVLPLSKTNQSSFLQRFQREAAVTQRLHHPNIVRLFGIFSGTDGQADVHFMAMELLQGRDLFEIVNADGPMPCRKAVEFIRQAALGLEHAHQAGLVHRDIKPGNLFLSDDQTVRVLDLGLAQDFDSEENLTREFNERVLGTADYLSPEQAADTHTVDTRSDIYSLGCSFFFLLTGQPPFAEGTLVQRLIAHQTKTPPAVSEFRRDVPDELIAILLKMMAKNRNDRFPTAAAIAEQLDDFLKATSSQKGLDAAPIVLKRCTPIAKIVGDSEPDFKHTGSETLRAGGAGPVDGSVDAAAVSEAGTYLPEFAKLLNQIASECDPEGPLGMDSRSVRLRTFANQLSLLEFTSTPVASPTSAVALPPKPTPAPKKTPDTKRVTPARPFKPTPDVSALQAISSTKWPAEDTVLNDIAAAGFRFDPAARRKSPSEGGGADASVMIEQLLAAVGLDSDRLGNDSGRPPLTRIETPRRKTKVKAVESPGTSKNLLMYGLIGGISLLLTIAGAVWFAFM